MLLVLVLVVVAFLSLAAFSFSQIMLQNRRAAIVAARQGQARALADSGVDALRSFLSQDQATQTDAGGIYDNADKFSARLVLNGDAPKDRGRFSIIAPHWQTGQLSGVRYGVEDESAKLNLNLVLAAENKSANAGQTMLMQLPGMTEDVADAILDWMDSDDTPRDQGAESDYYSTLNPPYATRNGPLQSLEEMLYIKGVTPALFFGPDINRNGQVDPNEPGGADLGGADNSDGSMNGGWASLLTIWSKENNVKSDGTARINVNGSDPQALVNDLLQVLSADQANYIVLYRQCGAPKTSGFASGNNLPPATPDLTTQLSGNTINSVLDLIQTGQQVQFTNPKTNTAYAPMANPFPGDSGSLGSYLPQLMDAVTTTSKKTLPGRININQAPYPVLMAIPNMTDEIAQNIIAQRPDSPADASADQQQPTWILTTGLVTLAQMKAMLPYMTTAGAVYRAQVVGYFDEGGPAARVEAILDTTTQPAAILSWKEVSQLGRGFTPDQLNLQPPAPRSPAGR